MRVWKGMALTPKKNRVHSFHDCEEQAFVC